MSQNRDKSLPPSPFSPLSANDWENWEDEDVVTPIEPVEQVLINRLPSSHSTTRLVTKSSNLRASRVSQQPRLKRLKSRHRQQAQNARAGIKLITDMTALRRQPPLPHQMRTPDGKPIKFVDAAALRALEGEPNSASVGNWNWLRRNQGKSLASATPNSSRTPGGGLSPEDRPIMIGINLPSEELTDRNMLTPQTAQDNTLLAPSIITRDLADGQNPPTQKTETVPGGHQHASVWSPDTPTPDTATTDNLRPASSIYSRATTMMGLFVGNPQDAPPVPALPTTYKKLPHQRLISLEMGGANGDEDDTGTPCTLFEEDGIPTPQSQKSKAKGSHFSPDSAGSRSRGWWDHVVTPFAEKRFTFTAQKSKLDSPNDNSPSERRDQPASPPNIPVLEKKSFPTLLPVPKATPPPIVRAPTPRRTPSPQSSCSESSSSGSSRRIASFFGSTNLASEKAQIIEIHDDRGSLDQPPPYSPPKKQLNEPVRYRAVLPPGHPLHAQFPPSPGLGSPGLAATMTSQGQTQMVDIPITPTVPRDMPSPPTMALPERPVGTFLPQEHSHDARGPENRMERERRRHEKEEVMARRVGGFWRGRGCVPTTGCFGRTGREGRKRRRVYFGIIGGLMAVIILVVVLSVVLTRPQPPQEIPSIWVNLTDFPPMPTGILSVVGPDNTVAKNGCTEPATLWSCSLPKDDHESVSPYRPNQPTIVMQIQWDNGTRRSWDVPDGKEPKSVERRAVGNAASAASIIRNRQAEKQFTPNPSPPTFEEMWFLGDTTDGVEADDKAGEPAPFYISIPRSASETADTPALRKRQTTIGEDDFIRDFISSPDLLEDGTPAPAVMLPAVGHQPVRLYDRGLPTEHYGFYTYFRRTIYLKSTARNNSTNEGDVPLDEDGGCKKSEANFLATWSETRMLVQIWTQKLDSNSSKLVTSDEREGVGGLGELIRPGTMPYPVTVTVDTHGGDPKSKFVWMWPMDARQKLDEDNPKLMANKLDFGGTVVNHRNGGDEAFGGFDGGSGGCKCEWVNWV